MVLKIYVCFVYIDLRLLIKKKLTQPLLLLFSSVFSIQHLTSTSSKAMSWSSSYLGLASLHVASSELCSFDHDRGKKHRSRRCGNAEPHVARRGGNATAVSDNDDGGAGKSEKGVGGWGWKASC